jgi:hypothetical protein
MWKLFFPRSLFSGLASLFGGGSVLSCLFVLGLSVAGQIEPDESNAELRLEVRRLVRRLDSPTLAGREAAEEELIALGPGILALLPDDEKRWSAEVMQRARRIRQVLESEMARATIRASTVTLHATDIPLLQIFSEIEQQTGNRIDAGRLQLGRQTPDLKLSVDFSDTPFWVAVDRVLDQANLTADTFGSEEKAILLRPRPPGHIDRAEQADYAGPFRFQPVRVEAVRDLRNPSNQALRVALEIAWEPRLNPISFQQPRSSLQALDENGRSLGVGAGSARPEISIMPATTATEVPVPLELPPRNVKRISKLTGTLAVLVPGKIETFRFKDLNEDKQEDKRIAHVTVALERVFKNGDLWEIRIGVRFDRSGDALASHYNWILDNDAHLEGGDGEPITSEASSTTRRAETEIGISYLFSIDGPLADYTFVYKTPGAILSREFEFELGDIELP